MLIACEACQNKISEQATSCPQCGHPNSRATRRSWVVVLALLALGVALVAWRLMRMSGATPCT